jgi:hypothetical protein
MNVGYGKRCIYRHRIYCHGGIFRHIFRHRLWFGLSVLESGFPAFGANRRISSLAYLVDG